MTDGPVTFLLVEDDDIHAHLVSRSMGRACGNNQLIRVADGAEALAFLRRQGCYGDVPRPDVVLLDLKLPKIDGHEVLAAIKEDKDLQMIPVVVMTTSRAESDLAKAYEHHANSYVVKPVDFQKFQQLVKDLSVYWGAWNEPPCAD